MQDKESSVKIKGLTITQANILAIMCDNGKLAESINEEIDRVSDGTGKFEKMNTGEPDLDYDTSEGDVDHEVNFDV